MQQTDYENDVKTHALRKLGLEPQQIAQLRSGSTIEITPTNDVVIRPESKRAKAVISEIENVALIGNGYYLVL